MGDVKEEKEDIYSFSSFLKETGNEGTDCFNCRLISSVGLMFGGLFILRNRNNFGKVNGAFQTVIGSGFLVASFLRLLALPPFQVTSNKYDSPYSRSA